MKLLAKYTSIFIILVSLTAFTTSSFVFYKVAQSNATAERSQTGQELGTSIEYDTVKLRETEDALLAFKRFCSTRTECTLPLFCKEFPHHCIFPTTTTNTTQEVTPIIQEKDITTDTTNTDSSSDTPPSVKVTPVQEKDSSVWCYLTRKLQLGGCAADPVVTSTPVRAITPTVPPTKPSVQTTTITPAANTVVLKSWCYDSDGENSASQGVCRDATGTYHDSCDGEKVTEYVCQGTWNGTQYTNQTCVKKTLSCTSPGSCQVSRCYEQTKTATELSKVPSPQPKITASQVYKSEKVNDSPPKQNTTSVPSAPTQQVAASESPVITFPASGAVIAKTISIEVDTKTFSTVTILLQPITSIKDQIYLSRVQSADQAVSWDTTLLPNGDYNLFAIAHGVGQKYISQPVRVTIRNESVETINQKLILPSDFKPERVPVDKNVIISQVETQPADAVQAVILQGTAEPNSVISLLIYSNPIVVTVRTDANGVWTYVLEEPLEPGNHTAYVVVPKEDGSQIRSEINTFFVPPVYASSVESQNLRSVDQTESPLIRNFVILAVILVLDAIMILLLVYHFKTKKKH